MLIRRLNIFTIDHITFAEQKPFDAGIHTVEHNHSRTFKEKAYMYMRKHMLLKYSLVMTCCLSLKCSVVYLAECCFYCWRVEGWPCLLHCHITDHNWCCFSCFLIFFSNHFSRLIQDYISKWICKLIKINIWY